MRILPSLLALALLPTAAFADPIDDFVKAQMVRSHIPGVAVAIVEDGKVASVRSYGTANLEWNAPVDGDTAFQLASATKLLTGVLLMKMAEEGKLSLADPIARFFDGAPESWSKIRVLQLANHTSGLSEDLGKPRPQTIEGLVAASMKAPLAYEPGTEARYGFIDFIVLRAILEKVSGKPFETLLADEVLTPIGLKHTRYAFQADRDGIRSYDVVPHRASIYAWGEGKQRGSDFLYGVNGHSAGALYSTANDMAAFFAALDSGFLKPESMKALQTAAILPGGKPNGFGVGWTVKTYRGVPVVGHSGGPALADILRQPERKITVIALANQQNYYPLLAEGIADHLLPAGPEPKAIKDKDPTGAALARTVLATAREGKLTGAEFTASGKGQMMDFLGGFGRNLLSALGPVQSLRLLKDEQAGDIRKRRYLITFETRPMPWVLETDQAGLVQAIYPTGEE